MAGRPCKKSIDELIIATKEDIQKYELRLTGLKKQLKEYEEQKAEQQKKELYQRMIEQNISFEEAITLLTNKQNNKEDKEA